MHAAHLAIEFRQQFAIDVILDLWCYRRFGHNETDDPSFTQPVMYQKIHALPSVRDLYAQKLIDAGVITADTFEKMKADVRAQLDAGQASAKEVRTRTSVSVFRDLWKDSIARRAIGPRKPR